MGKNIEKPSQGGAGPEIGKLEDNIRHKPLAESINKLKIKVELFDGGIVPLYIACPEKLLPDLVQYVARQLEIPDSNIFDVLANSTKPDIRSELENLYNEKLQHGPGQIFLAVARGLKDAAEAAMPRDRKTIPPNFRVVHDYNQVMVENFHAGDRLQEQGTRLIILTHIDQAIEKNLYEALVSDAAGSRFSYGGIIEVGR
ncbi:MAG: hypothetical protein Q8P49_03885 [Candidatus Liptonbacteria bacterium]|nr:hypothetical protein [Candidatus Liptonbacteria bacterium]